MTSPTELNVQSRYETIHVKKHDQYSGQLQTGTDKVNKLKAALKKQQKSVTHSFEKNAAAGKASKGKQEIITICLHCVYC